MVAISASFVIAMSHSLYALAEAATDDESVPAETMRRKRRRPEEKVSKAELNRKSRLNRAQAIQAIREVLDLDKSVSSLRALETAGETLKALLQARHDEERMFNMIRDLLKLDTGSTSRLDTLTEVYVRWDTNARVL